MEQDLKPTLEVANDFDGVFRFTNPTDEDFVAMWNNKEYLFPAKTTCPMIIPNETLEGIQEIRKKWAYKLSVREFYNHSPLYKKLVKEGGLYPATPADKALEAFVQACLTPLPIARAKVREVRKPKVELKASKALDKDKSANVQFIDEEEKNSSNLGEMPDKQLA